MSGFYGARANHPVLLCILFERLNLPFMERRSKYEISIGSVKNYHDESTVMSMFVVI